MLMFKQEHFYKNNNLNTQTDIETDKQAHIHTHLLTHTYSPQRSIDIRLSTLSMFVRDTPPTNIQRPS